MVAVSTLALRSFVPGSAAAQINISCPVHLNFGRHISCGSGQFIVRPSGTSNAAGCLIKIAAAQPGRCILSTGGVPPTKSVNVSFTNNTVTMGGPGDTAVVKRFRMAENGSNTERTRLTFSPTEVMNTVTINIGGRMDFSSNQVIGSYATVNRIVVDLAP